MTPQRLACVAVLASACGHLHDTTTLSTVRARVTLFTDDAPGCRVPDPFPQWDGSQQATSAQTMERSNGAYADDAVGRVRRAAMCCALLDARFVHWTKVEKEPEEWAPVCAFGLKPLKPSIWRERNQGVRFDWKRRHHPNREYEVVHTTVDRAEGLSCARTPVPEHAQDACREVCDARGLLLRECVLIPYVGDTCWPDARCGP